MYLPAAELTRYGLTTQDIAAMHRGERAIDAAYGELMEGLMAVADADYQLATEGLRHLPPEFRRAATVACAVYQGIHDAIRCNGYDNMNRRAYTTARRKAALAATALMKLARDRVMATARQ
jgi:phytoene synthase